MFYYCFCLFLLAIFFFFLLSTLFHDLKKSNNGWQRILLCIVLALVFKYDFGTIFCGMEYEDAYAFSFLAREFSNGLYTSSFLSEGIGIGSLDNPIMMQTYGGHFITYSALLSLPVRLFGFSFSVISLTTCFLQFLVLLLLSVFPRIDGQYKWMIAPIVYCISPIINVFGNTFLCEPFSGLIVISFVYLFYYQKKERNNPYPMLIALFVAILTKRENLVLIALPIIHYSYLVYKERALFHKNDLYSLTLIFLLLVVYICMIQNVLDIESTEAQDIETSTFSFSYFTRLAPVFIKSMCNPFFFGVTTILLFIILAISFYNKSIQLDSIAVLCIWLLYFFSYTSHYRGYFFIQGQNACAFDTFRYLNNYYCLTTIIISMIIAKMRIDKYIPSILILLSVFSLYQTFTLRNTFSEEEWVNRFSAPQKTLDILENERLLSKSVIISPDILTLQNLGNNSLFVCDAFNYNLLDFNMDGVNYYFLCRDGDVEYLKKRFGLNVDMNRWSIIAYLGTGYCLYKYELFN